METSTLQGRRSATLSICGDFTDEGAVRAAAELERLAGEAFYREVVVEVTSEGGSFAAMRHLADAFGRLARDGVRVVTRVPIRAASAAATLASLGTDREASAHATLMYHGARVAQMPMVTAHMAEALGGTLGEADRLVIGDLAARSLQAAGPEGAPDDAAARLGVMDREVLARLAGNPDGGPAEGIRRIRAVLAHCRGPGGPEPFAEVLRRLFDMESPISPALALELGLIDRALPPGGAAREGAPASGPALEVPEWGALYPGGMVEEAQLRRHVLVLGESGSGKTASGVLPLAAALARTPERLACALVIDPKRELLGRLREAAAPGVDVRAVALDELQGLRVMGAGEAGLRADMEAGRVLTAATRDARPLLGAFPQRGAGHPRRAAADVPRPLLAARGRPPGGDRPCAGPHAHAPPARAAGRPIRRNRPCASGSTNSRRTASPWPPPSGMGMRRSPQGGRSRTNGGWACPAGTSSAGSTRPAARARTARRG